MDGVERWRREDKDSMYTIHPFSKESRGRLNLEEAFSFQLSSSSKITGYAMASCKLWQTCTSLPLDSRMTSISTVSRFTSYVNWNLHNRIIIHNHILTIWTNPQHYKIKLEGRKCYPNGLCWFVCTSHSNMLNTCSINPLSLPLDPGHRTYSPVSGCSSGTWLCPQVLTSLLPSDWCV